jgi:NAD(P)-dependent dehydrogenase (short-subunit alcohol dehydrogenase family)
MARWGAGDIADLAGRQAVVTGANSGLGWQTARQLAAHGAKVVLACRSVAKGEEAADRIRGLSPDAGVEVIELDLADLASVRRFADAYQSGHEGLDVLVNNAGVMALPRRTSADGFEMQFGTNHLGHFALTGLLLPSLLTRPGARVVTVSSQVAMIGRVNFDDLQGERRYQKWSAYGQSKLANLLFAFELDRRAGARGLDLISVAAHPGYAATNLQTAGPAMSGHRLEIKGAEIANRLFGQSDADGALPILYGASAPDVTGGQYFGPDRLFGSRGHPTTVHPPRSALDEATGRHLWEVSEQLTDVYMDALPAAG